MTFVFAKLHFKNLFSESTMNEFFSRLTEVQSIPLDKGKYTWRIGGVKTINFESQTVLFGRLGKVQSAAVGTTWDEDKKDFVEEVVNSRLAYYLQFALDKGSYTMAIEESKVISTKVFIKRLQEFMGESGVGVFDVDFLSDKTDVYGAIKKWDRIAEAKFWLVPSNPSSDPDFSELDKMVTGSGAKQVVVDCKSPTGDGVVAANNNLVEQGIAMSSAGYGNFKLRGQESGEERVIIKSNMLNRAIYRGESEEQVKGELANKLKGLSGDEKK